MNTDNFVIDFNKEKSEYMLKKIVTHIQPFILSITKNSLLSFFSYFLIFLFILFQFCFLLLI